MCNFPYSFVGSQGEGEVNVLTLELEDSMCPSSRNFLMGMRVGGGNNGEDFSIRFAVTFVSS